MTQIDHLYFTWLIEQIEVPNNQTYYDLFERLHNLEFVWIVPHDGNRAQDGLDLRREFLGDSKKKLSLEIVTLLEVWIALSRRAAFTGGGYPQMWAWRFIRHLGLQKASDPLVGAKADRADDIIHALVWRTYQRNGRGGFFPLRQAKEDQTKVEIWYQMQAYVIENSSY